MKTTFYGELQNIIVITLPAARELSLQTTTKLLLADIRTCKADYEGPLGIPLYMDSDFEVPQVMDMTCVQCAIGRFQLVKENGRSAWAIIDRSGENADAIVGADDDG